NGSVIEINYNDTNEIQDINFCYVGLKNPLNFYPLFDQYILVTYAHATNTSDNTTFMDRGMVLDWSGNVISRLVFGSSYLIQGTTSWYPDEFIVNNINPRKGFLRLSVVSGTTNFKWSQFGYIGNGEFILLQNDTVGSVEFSSFQVTVFATLNGGYAIVYANTTNKYPNDPMSTTFTPKAGIYALLLGQNQTTTTQQIILYEMPTPNMTFSNLFCSVDYVFIGHTCIISVLQSVLVPSNINVTYSNVTTSTLFSPTTTSAIQVITPVNVTTVNTTAPPNITTKTFYIKIRFLSTGSVMTLNPIFNVSSINANIRTLPLGGYAFISRQPNAGIVTFNFSLYDEYNKLSNWPFPLQTITSNLVGAFDIIQNNSMLVAQNESGSTWNLLSINFPILAPYQDGGYGNLQVNSTYPQRNSVNIPLNTGIINITFNDPVLLSDGNLTIYQIINQTNVPRQLIYSRICTIGNCMTSNNLVSLQVLPSTFNDPGGSYYIQMGINFVMSAVYKEPLLGINPNIWNPTGLNNSGKAEFFNNLINDLLFIIPTEKGRLDSNKNYQIDKPLSNVVQYLIPLTIYEMRKGDKKNATSIHDDLNTLIKNKDYTGITLYGNTSRFLDIDYGFQRATLFVIAKIKSPESQNFIIIQIGITIFRTTTVTMFTFTSAKAIINPNLYIPSLVFLFVPIILNLLVAFTIIFFGKGDFSKWFSKYGRTATSFAMLSDIPQFIIQILYINNSVEYDILPLFTLIASGLSLSSNIISKLFFIKYSAYSPYLSNFYDHHAVESNNIDEHRNSYEEDEEDIF
ncbi:6782_t:CDS:10, partial [Scutellospora calospora]